MGYRAKQDFKQWNLKWSRSTYKMFNILSHQGNANKNDPEITLYTNQNSLDQKFK